METGKRYALYEYLVFFWKKKWLLILIPVIAAALVYALSAFAASGYEGKAVFYTSSTKLDSLTSPEILKADLSQKLGHKIEADVLSKSRMRLSMSGGSEAEIEEAFSQAVEDYEKELLEDYRTRYDFTEENIGNAQDTLADAEEAYGIMIGVLRNSNESSLTEEFAELAEATALTLDNVSSERTKIKNMSTDLLFFEEPRLISSEIEKNDSNALANSILTFVISLFLTVLGLMLAKYILDARRGQLHD
ncbi:hypothetical protein GJU40_08370 [Bacillus lacus]|uniref:Polysaccharide chain length determinant N-terminal domain-containing protein n=1 Tax=Metabacillus lacus TaxID=1983721 RepID=A0A7X2IYU7_9BACI|nr:hypothetical protein [Metabacillus lacus]MRX72164.1 hypothetical protein [Metabacillus lacus]